MSLSYEELLDEVKYLRGCVGSKGEGDRALELRMALGLTKSQAGILAAMEERPRISHDTIYSLVFEKPNGDGPFPKIVNVTMSPLRKKLEALGCPVSVKSIHGWGYQMSDEMAAWVRATVPTGGVQ